MAIERPKLKLHRGSTYVFDVSDPSLASHPLRFTNDSGTTEYTNGVTAAGNSGSVYSTVTFAVPNSAPDNLMYYCGTHGIGMGNRVKIIDNPNPPIMSWNGDRAVAFDGTNGLAEGYRNIIDYFDITTLGDATDFGDPEQGQYTDGVVSNGSRIVYGRHGATVDGGSGAPHDDLSYVTSSTPGNAAAFGTLTYSKSNQGSGSNGTYGLFSGGFYSTGVSTIDYITIDTIGNGTNFGNLTKPGNGRGSSGDTYMLHVFDIDHTSGLIRTDAIDRMTIGTSGTATDFGDQINILSNRAVTEDTTRVVIAGGRAHGNPDYWLRDFIEYVTVDTPGNASSFGNLLLRKQEFGAVSNSTRGVFVGGQKHSDNANPGNSYAVHDDLEYITIQTTGNAQAFGNLTSARNKLDAGSGAAA